MLTSIPTTRFTTSRLCTAMLRLCPHPFTKAVITPGVSEKAGLQAEFDVYNQTPGFQCEGFLILDSCTPTMHGTKGGGCVLGAKEDACRGGQDRVTKAASSATHPL